jgi:hypothetical protein
MSSVKFNPRFMDRRIRTKDAGVIVVSVTGIDNAIVKCLFTANKNCIHK